MRALVVALAACGIPQPVPHAASRPALYDRLGGRDAIASVVKDLVEVQLVHDKRLAPRFAKVETANLEEQLTAQLCELTGGPCTYTGRSMRDAHAGLAITEADFTAFVDDLGVALRDANIGAGEQKEIVALLQEMHDQIVPR